MCRGAEAAARAGVMMGTDCSQLLPWLGVLILLNAIEIVLLIGMSGTALAASSCSSVIASSTVMRRSWGIAWRVEVDRVALVPPEPQLIGYFAVGHRKPLGTAWNRFQA